MAQCYDSQSGYLFQEIKKSKQVKSSTEGVRVDGFNLLRDDRPPREPANLQLPDSDSDVVVMKVDERIGDTSEEVARALQEREWQLEDRVDMPGATVETSEEIAVAFMVEDVEGEQIASDPTRRMIFEKFDEKASLASSVVLVQ